MLAAATTFLQLRQYLVKREAAGCPQPDLDVTFDVTNVAFVVTEVTFWPRQSRLTARNPEAMKHRGWQDTSLLRNEFLECTLFRIESPFH